MQDEETQENGTVYTSKNVITMEDIFQQNEELEELPNEIQKENEDDE